MIPFKFQSLIDALVQKTNNENAVWIKTSNPTEYKIRLDSGFITIGYVNDKDGKTEVEFNVFNNNGSIQDSIKINSSSDDYNTIIHLYNSVHESYSKIDPFFTNLLNEIQIKEKIGNRNE